MPEIAWKTYHLQVVRPSLIKKGEIYYDPIGAPEATAEKAKSWLKPDFNIFKEQPNIKYRIVEVIHYKSDTNVVEEGERSPS